MIQLVAVAVVPRDGIAVGRRAELRGVFRLPCHGRDLRAPRIVEDVGDFGAARLRRGVAGVRGRRVVFDLFVIQLLTVAVKPCDLVLVHGLVKLRGVLRGTGDGGDFGTPRIVERKAELRRFVLRRGVAGVSGRLAVFDVFVIQLVAVAVVPRDRIGDGLFLVLRPVGCLPVHGSDLRRPARESEGVSVFGILHRGDALVNRELSGFHVFRVERLAALVHEADLIRQFTPLRVQGDVFCDTESLPVGVLRAAVLGQGAPAVESIAGAAEFVLFEVDPAAVRPGLGRHRTAAVVGIKGDHGRTHVL